MEDKDFIGKIWPQNCGDNLLVLNKSNKQNKDKKYLFCCQFQKYPFEGFYTKQNILNGRVNNPQIEQVEFIDKIWPQNCGDSLKIIEKSDIKQGNSYLWKCEFVKYPCIIYSIKSHIIEGCVNNSNIEIDEFINKIYPQFCGDDLLVIEKSNKKIGTSFLYKCEFQKYPYIIYETKSHILRGKISNPKIDENLLLNREFPQNCGDILKVNKKIIKDNNILWECEFTKYPYKVLAKKSDILKGRVINSNLPYKNKDTLIKFIQDNFREKPTLDELANFLKISRSHLGAKINEFQLREYIKYYLTYTENEIREYINTLIKTSDKEEYFEYDKKYLGLDIYIPNLKIGFEYNGSYWHSSLFKNQNFHQEKSLFFEKLNIDIYHIFEYEWNDKQEILKSLIKSKLGIFKKKIYARQCEIKELSYREYAQFCNENHLQGECGAKVKLGLYYQEELVQIMSFSLPRFTDKYEWEIIRETSKLDYIIIGGKEKLWSYFIKKYNPNNCISYCDFSKFNGESYLRLGFKKIGLNKPGFVWWCNKTNQVFWRNPYKHKEMKEAGYLKIYDAGQLVFVWNKI
jgi:AraC-like DNA-binding protein